MSGVWTAVAAGVGAVGSYMSAREQSKAAKQAAKTKETYQYHTPYMNEYISQIAPYILSMQQKIFENRLKGYGLNPQDFSPIAAMLSGISSSYSGVGKPGDPVANSRSLVGAQVANPYAWNYGWSGGQPPSQQQQQQQTPQMNAERVAARRAAMAAGGGMPELRGGPGRDWSY